MRWPKKIVVFEDPHLTWEDAAHPVAKRWMKNWSHRIYVLAPERKPKKKRRAALAVRPTESPGKKARR